jgi:heme exporter protein C
MQSEHLRPVVWTSGGTLLLAGLLAAALWAIFIGAPSEQTMGAAQRIVYIHVAVAWLGLLGFVAMGTAGVSYLIRRDLKWDEWFQAAGEVGWLCCGLTLVTGSFWAHEAWGTWWTWDPRLTTSFILWATYSGILIIRVGLEDPHQRARIGAILAVLGALDIPLVVMATRWFRGVHPVSPSMTSGMRATLLITVVAFTAFFVALTVRRRIQLRLAGLLDQLHRQVGVSVDVARGGGSS